MNFVLLENFFALAQHLKALWLVTRFSKVVPTATSYKLSRLSDLLQWRQKIKKKLKFDVLTELSAQIWPKQRMTNRLRSEIFS